jgi:hypothetical protein
LAALAESGNPGVAEHALWALRQFEQQGPAGVSAMPEQE